MFPVTTTIWLGVWAFKGFPPVPVAFAHLFVTFVLALLFDVYMMHFTDAEVDVGRTV